MRAENKFSARFRNRKIFSAVVRGDLVVIIRVITRFRGAEKILLAVIGAVIITGVVTRITVRIHKTARIIKRVTVPVKTLRIIRRLHQQIRAEETAQVRVINTPAHVDEVVIIQLVVASEAGAGKECGRWGARFPVWIIAARPRHQNSCG